MHLESLIFVSYDKFTKLPEVIFLFPAFLFAFEATRLLSCCLAFCSLSSREIVKIFVGREAAFVWNFSYVFVNSPFPSGSCRIVTFINKDIRRERFNFSFWTKRRRDHATGYWAPRPGLGVVMGKLKDFFTLVCASQFVEFSFSWPTTSNKVSNILLKDFDDELPKIPWVDSLPIVWHAVNVINMVTLLAWSIWKDFRGSMIWKKHFRKLYCFPILTNSSAWGKLPTTSCFPLCLQLDFVKTQHFPFSVFPFHTHTIAHLML